MDERMGEDWGRGAGGAAGHDDGSAGQGGRVVGRGDDGAGLEDGRRDWSLDGLGFSPCFVHQPWTSKIELPWTNRFW